MLLKICRVILLNTLVVLVSSTQLLAGPPYDTDDPEPVGFQHWEFYCASMGSTNSGTGVGTAPYLELNYGAIPNLHLHVMTPLSFYSIRDGKTNYGIGDVELGAKFRFINKDSSRFQVCIYPAVELPTANAGEGLGNGKTQLFLPLWIQKTFGKLSTDFGGGYWINPGSGNKNYEFFGWQAQYQIAKNVSIGGELNYVTPTQINASSDFKFNVGSIIDLSNKHHLLFSIGRSIIGNTNLQWYFGYQLTI